MENTTDNKPTPRQIDRLAKKFDALKKKIAAEAKKLDIPKAELIALAQKFGVITRKAKKSYRLDGLAWYVLATYGHRTEVNHDAVQKLQLALVELGRGRTFKNYFRPDIEYLAAPDAIQALKKLPHDERRRIVRLYRACFVVKPQAVSLDVKQQKKETMARREPKKAQKASA